MVKTLTGKKTTAPLEQHNLVYHMLCEVNHLPIGEIKDKQSRVVMRIKGEKLANASAGLPCHIMLQITEK